MMTDMAQGDRWLDHAAPRRRVPTAGSQNVLEYEEKDLYWKRVDRGERVDLRAKASQSRKQRPLDDGVLRQHGLESAAGMQILER